MSTSNRRSRREKVIGDGGEHKTRGRVGSPSRFDNGSKEAENQRVTIVKGSGMTFGILFWASSHKHTFSP